MPKEIIADSVGCFDVRVGWERDSCVQVATEMREPTTPEGPKNLHELVRQWEAIPLPPEVESIPLSEYGSRGLYATLDREGINQLIRVLRRARDQAFGRDE